MNVYTEVDGLADGISVRAVVFRVSEAVEMIPSDKVVGVDVEAALAHVSVTYPLFRQRVGDLDIFQTQERAVLEEEGVLALVVVGISVVMQQRILGVGKVLAL